MKKALVEQWAMSKVLAYRYLCEYCSGPNMRAANAKSFLGPVSVQVFMAQL